MSEASTILGERTPPAGASGDDVTDTESPDAPPGASGKRTDENTPLDAGTAVVFLGFFEGKSVCC